MTKASLARAVVCQEEALIIVVAYNSSSSSSFGGERKDGKGKHGIDIASHRIAALPYAIRYGDRGRGGHYREGMRAYVLAGHHQAQVEERMNEQTRAKRAGIQLRHTRQILSFSLLSLKHRKRKEREADDAGDFAPLHHVAIRQLARSGRIRGDL